MNRKSILSRPKQTVNFIVSGLGFWSDEQDKRIKIAKMNYSICRKKSNFFPESKRDFSDLIHVNNWQDCIIWQYWLWSFQTEDTILDRFLPKNQHTQRKLLNFEFWVNGELSKNAKIWLSKSIFYVNNHPNLSQFFFIEEYQFRSKSFVIDIFW